MNINIKILDYIIGVLELNAILDEKHQAVKVQDFLKAADLREKENELRGQIMNADQLRELRKLLLESENIPHDTTHTL